MPKPIELRQNMIIEIKDGMQHAEKLLDDLSRDPPLRQQFAQSPGQVLAQYKLTPTDDPSSLDTANRIFLSIVTNPALVDWVRKNEPAVENTKAATDAVRRWAQGKADLSMPPSTAVEPIREILRNEQFLYQLVNKLASDPAVSAALPEGIGAPELQTWLDETLIDLRKGTAFSDLPRPRGHDGELKMWGVILVIILALAVLAVMVVIDANDGMLPARTEDRLYTRVNNLYEFSQALSQLRRP